MYVYMIIYIYLILYKLLKYYENYKNGTLKNYSFI